MQKSFWGVFGNGVLMDFSVYHVIEIAMQVSLLGLVVQVIRQARRRTLDTAAWIGLLLVTLWALVVYVALLRFMQTVDATNQGRLMFPAISSLSLLFLLGLAGFFPRRFIGMPVATAGVALMALAIMAPFRYIMPAYAQPPRYQRLADAAPAAGMPVRFGEGIELLNYRITPPEVRAGSVVHVALDWRCVAPMKQSYKMFAHVLGYDDVRLTQIDTVPYHGRFATLLWQPGQEFRDEYDLFITGKARPSLGKIQIGFFPWQDPGQRLPVYTADSRLLGDHFELNAFKIAPKSLQRPNIDNPLHVQFGKSISLLGYALRTSPPARPSHALTFTLYWETAARVSQDYIIFVHILSNKDEIVAQQDAPPQRGNYPISIWAPGEVVVDEHSLPLPADMSAGDYRLALGLYDPQNGQRLPAEAVDLAVSDGRVVITNITVEPRQ
jgi:hypothetical protein